MRDLGTGLQTAVSADSLAPFFAVKLDFPEGAIRVWSGIGAIEISGEEYLGVGVLGTISAITETTQNAVQGVTLTLTGVPTDMLATTLTARYQGSDCRIFFGALNDFSINANTGALATRGVATDPYQIFRGRVDVMNVDQGADSAKITVTVENRLIDFERARVRRYTPEDQAIDFPNDKGFDFVARIQDFELTWGT